MKKILLFLILIALSLPTTIYGAVSVPWQANSTSSPVTPYSAGRYYSIQVPYFIATSTTATSSIAGTLMLGQDLWNGALQYGGFFQAVPPKLQISNNTNDMVSQVVIGNSNPGAYAATSITFNNGSTTLNGVSSTNYGALTYTGGGYGNAYIPALVPNSLVMSNNGGPLWFGALSATSSLAKIYFALAPGYTSNNADVTISADPAGSGRGFLGIGTTTPTRPFVVENNGLQSQIMISATGASSNQRKWAFFASTTGAFNINSMTDADVATQRLTILQSGNVGIGTTSPTNLLYVNAVANSNDGINIGDMFRLRNSTASNNFILEHLPTTGNLYVRSSTGSDISGNLLLNDNGASVGVGTTNPQNVFDVAGKFGVSSTTGYVSVGTSSPSYNFDVYGNSGTTTVRVRAPSGQASNIDFYRTDSFIASRLLVDSSSNVSLFTANDVATPKLTVTSAGNLGVGTSTPLNKLTVVGGGLTIGQPLTYAVNGISIKQQANTLTNGILLENATTSDAGGMYMNGTVLTLRNGGIDTLSATGGNVGIGTTTPAAALQVNASTGGEIIRLQASGQTTRTYGLGIAPITASFYVNDNFSGAQRLTITPAGNIGIGTTTPTTALTVNGSITSTSTPPTLSSCGTSPTVKGTNNWGQVTVGATGTGCTVTFANAYPTSAACTVTPETGSVVNTFSYTVSNSAIVVTQTGLGGNKFDYNCGGI